MYVVGGVDTCIQSTILYTLRKRLVKYIDLRNL